jgi:hypothetical protein
MCIKELEESIIGDQFVERVCNEHARLEPLHIMLMMEIRGFPSQSFASLKRSLPEKRCWCARMAVVSLAPDPYTGLLAPLKRGVSSEYTLHRARLKERHCADAETNIVRLEARSLKLKAWETTATPHMNG